MKMKSLISTDLMRGKKLKVTRVLNYLRAFSSFPRQYISISFGCIIKTNGFINGAVLYILHEYYFIWNKSKLENHFISVMKI